jgi:hypothetical protein
MEEQNQNINSIHDTTLHVENLQINDDDDDLEIEIDETQVQKQSFNLVGRFLTNRPIRTNMMMNKMGDIWQPGRGMDIEEVHPGLYVFKFFHQLDIQHILKQGPWSFDNHTLVLNILPENEDPRDVSLHNLPFWIQIHNLPSGYMSQKTGEKVGNYIGEFLEYDEKNDSLSWRKYMRIRVLVDIRMPLKKSKKIKKAGGDSVLVHFKYERLGTFCYVCGLLGHSENKCPTLFEKETTTVMRGWGPDLRADMGRRHRSESKWLRQGGDPNWVAPDPVLMNIKCGTINPGSNSSNNDKKINTQNEERGEGSKLVTIFSKPEILFPVITEAHKSANHEDETMNDYEVEELIIEGDRKRPRNMATTSHVAQHKHGNEEQHDSHRKVDSCSNDKHFLSAGPGGARQGQ